MKGLFDKKQQGSVLIITLLLMLMLTLLAITQVSLNSTQTRIASNTADTQIAFQTTEGALNEATNNLFAGNYAASDFLTNTKGLYLFNANQAPLWITIDWGNSNAVIPSFQGSSKTQADFIIELLPSIVKSGQNIAFPTQVYRITARAVGPSGGSAVILQTTVQIQ